MQYGIFRVTTLKFMQNFSQSRSIIHKKLHWRLIWHSKAVFFQDYLTYFLHSLTLVSVFHYYIKDYFKISRWMALTFLMWHWPQKLNHSTNIQHHIMFSILFHHVFINKMSRNKSKDKNFHNFINIIFWTWPLKLTEN